MRLLNAPNYADVPNTAYPFMGSNRLGYVGATGNPNPFLLKVAPDTALWQTQATIYNQDRRYGIVGTVGLCGVNLGVPTSGTFVDLSAPTRFHVGRFDRTSPRANYPMRPVIAGAAAARINPAAQWYNAGYTTALSSQSDMLSSMLAKPGVGGYAG